MAAEDAVVDMIFNVATRLLISGTEVGLKVVGEGAKAIGITFYSLAKTIAEKERTGKKLTAGENAFKNLITCGEEIHSIWLKESDLENFKQLTTQMEVPYVAIKNGDELEKSHKFLKKKDKSNKLVEFADDYKDKVSISFRASDDVRMAHIIEMFDTFNHAKTTMEKEKTVDKIEQKVDEIEKFIKESGVKFENPPQVIDSKEVEKKQSKVVSENDLKISAKNQISMDCYENSKFDSFKIFGFKNDKNLNVQNLNVGYNKFIKDNSNVSGKDIIEAMYNASNLLLENPSDNKVHFCYEFFGFNYKPTTEELNVAYKEKLEKNITIKDVADIAYKDALKKLEGNKSVRTKLQAKKELNNIKTLVTPSKAIQKDKNIEITK